MLRWKLAAKVARREVVSASFMSRRSVRSACCLVALLVTSPASWAQSSPEAEPSEPAPTERATTPEESLGHGNQLGLGVRFGSGYRMLIPYNEEYCGEREDSGESKSLCRDRYPFWLELSPSYGLTDALELLVDVRIFLESPDFTNATGILLAPGFKYYTDAEDQLKFYLTGQLVFEIQEQDKAENPDLGNFDFGLRSALGMQLDLLRYVGLYVQAGLIFGFTRWFSFLADLSGGLQVRY